MTTQLKPCRGAGVLPLTHEVGYEPTPTVTPVTDPKTPSAPSSITGVNSPISSPATSLLADPSNADLGEWQPLPEAMDANQPMSVREKALWSNGDAETGLWECTAGPSYWVQETHEVIQVLRGSMTVTTDDGQITDVGTGDVAVFPRGWRGTWLIHETLLKVYTVM